MPRTRTKSEFVSSAGTVFELVKKLSDKVDSLGGSNDDLRRIIRDDDVTQAIAELLVDLANLQTFDLSVDYSRSLAAVVAAGLYGFVHPNVTEENFPTDRGYLEVGGGRAWVTEATLLRFDRIVKSDDVLREMHQMGLRPGTMFELAHFGEQHPSVQCRFPIVALGSFLTWPEGGRSVGYIYEGDGERRKLNFKRMEDWWGEYYHFLAFRK